MDRSREFIFDYYPGMQFIRAYEETKAITEMSALDAYAEQVSPMSGNMKFIDFPFYVAYQTMYKKKEHYPDMTVWIKQYDEDEQPVSGDYLMMLADSLLLIDDMLYEHYRAVLDIYRNCVHRCIQQNEMYIGDTSEAQKLAYAIAAGCRRGYIHAEKYMSIARKLERQAEGTKSSSELESVLEEMFSKEED